MQWTQEAADIWKCTNKSTSVPSLVRAKPKRLRGCSSGPCMWHLGPRSTWRFFKTETNSLVQTGLVGTGRKVWRQLPSSPALLGALDNSILNPLVNCLRPPRLSFPYRTLASWLFFLLIRSFLPTTGAGFCPPVGSFKHHFSSIPSLFLRLPPLAEARLFPLLSCLRRHPQDPVGPFGRASPALPVDLETRIKPCHADTSAVASYQLPSYGILDIPIDAPSKAFSFFCSLQQLHRKNVYPSDPKEICQAARSCCSCSLIR